MKKAELKNILLLFYPFIATAVMLTVIQPPISWAALAWAALVPFILVCSPTAKPFSLAVISYLVSLCYWLANLYWIGPVTISGWVAFCLYTAVLWPIVTYCLRFCRIKKIPLFLAVPVLFVGAERLQGFFLGGFFWRHLSHSQYANITLIQIADIFGSAGVSFLVAMVNGLLAELIIAVREKNILRVSNFLKTAVVCIALVAAVAYGQWRINQSDKFIEAGPVIGAVQSNIPQSVKESAKDEDKIETFAKLLQDSNACIKTAARLVVWPETMVQAALDARILKLLDAASSHKFFDEALRKHSKDNAFVLVGAYGGTAEIQKDWTVGFAQRYNSAFLYQPDGTQSDRQYNKIHLVPFGEIVPFRKSAPWLHNLLMKFTPYDYDYSLDYGKEYTVFEMTGSEEAAQRVYKFGVMICYEDTVPEIARNFAIDKQGAKKVDWLVNISNDGWFVRFKDGKVFPSTELSQHTAACVFRAVENRLSVLRSVNTGISCLIDTAGRVKDGFIGGTLPRQAMARIGCNGWFVDEVSIDKRTTFFSRHGQWLDFYCTLCLISLIIVPHLGRFFRKKTESTQINSQGRPNGKYTQKS